MYEVDFKGSMTKKNRMRQRFGLIIPVGFDNSQHFPPWNDSARPASSGTLAFASPGEGVLSDLTPSRTTYALIRNDLVRTNSDYPVRRGC